MLHSAHRCLFLDFWSWDQSGWVLAYKILLEVPWCCRWRSAKLPQLRFANPPWQAHSRYVVILICTKQALRTHLSGRTWNRHMPCPLVLPAENHMHHTYLAWRVLRTRSGFFWEWGQGSKNAMQLPLPLALISRLRGMVADLERKNK